MGLLCWAKARQGGKKHLATYGPTFRAGEVADGFNVVGRKLLTTLLAVREREEGNRLSAAADAETSLISQREEGGWDRWEGREIGRLLSRTSAVNNGMGSIEYTLRAGGRAMK